MSIFDTYYPSGNITSGTRLGPGITCAKFLGARGSRTNWERHDEFGNPDRVTIAQNLYQHARAMQTVYSNFDFNEVRLTVSDGVYTPAEGESAGGINADRVIGKAIGYKWMGLVATDTGHCSNVMWQSNLDLGMLKACMIHLGTVLILHHAAICSSACQHMSCNDKCDNGVAPELTFLVTSASTWVGINSVSTWGYSGHLVASWGRLGPTPPTLQPSARQMPGMPRR